MTKSEWKNACKDMTFKEAMRQRKMLGERGLWGSLNLIPYEKDKGEKNSSKSTKK